MGMGPGYGASDDGHGRSGFRHRWRGDLTKDENDARIRERFARLDRNSDGVIDASEVEASINERMNERRGRLGDRMSARFIQRYDTNNDGKVSREEFNDAVRKRFAEMDLNNDGRITDDDLPPMMRGRDALKASAGGFGGRGGRSMSFLRGADANNDGVITLDEALAQAGKTFAQLDRNKDNVVDQADADAMRKEMVDYRVKQFMHRYGADNTGKVTREQFSKVAGERFAMRDLNNDGRITRDEMPGRGGWGGRGHRGDGDRGGEGRGPGMGMGPGAPNPAGPGNAPAPGKN